jgi:hypothetical protein
VDISPRGFFPLFLPGGFSKWVFVAISATYIPGEIEEDFGGIYARKFFLVLLKFLKEDTRQRFSFKKDQSITRPLSNNNSTIFY